MSQKTSNKKNVNEPEFCAFIAIDWADEKHDISLQVAGKTEKKTRTIEHTPAALNDWVSELRQQFGCGKIAVCLEQSKGALINFLINYDLFVLYPLNPKSLAKFREAFRPSKAKDDPTDTDFILEIITKHRHKLKPWKPDDALIRTLNILAEKRRNAVDRRKMISNQLKSALKAYFPQVFDLISEDLFNNLSCQFLLKWPTLQELQKAKNVTIEKFYHQHHCYGKELINSRIKRIQKAIPLTTDQAILMTSPIEVKMLVHQLQQITDAIDEYNHQLAKLYPQHPYAKIFRSFPGAGPVGSVRLASAFGIDKQRYQSCSDMQIYSGVAPITIKSGNSCWVSARYFCPKYLRQTFTEHAGQSIKYSVWAKAYYTMQSKKGKKHHAIIRALAYKWIRIIFRCWKENKPYDEIIYIKSLQKKKAEILKYIATA